MTHIFVDMWLWALYLRILAIGEKMIYGVATSSSTDEDLSICIRSYAKTLQRCSSSVIVVVTIDHSVLVNTEAPNPAHKIRTKHYSEDGFTFPHYMFMSTLFHVTTRTHCTIHLEHEGLTHESMFRRAEKYQILQWCTPLGMWAWDLNHLLKRIQCVTEPRPKSMQAHLLRVAVKFRTMHRSHYGSSIRRRFINHNTEG